MSVILSSQQFIFYTDIGSVVTTVNKVSDYNVEDIIHDRALSQMILISMINQGQNIDVNTPTIPRTVETSFLQNNVQLPE